MAEALIFHYRQQKSFLNAANPTTKFFSVLVLCLVLVSASLAGAGIIALFLLLAIVNQHLPLLRYRRELRFFIFLLLLIFVTEYLAKRTIIASVVAIIRFAAIILCGMLLSDSTAPDDLARSLGKLLDHIPFINGWTIASSIELTLSILPLIFDASLEVSTARRARLERKTNPYRSVIMVSESILSLLLDKTEDLANALQARNFEPSRPRESLRYRKVDLYLALLILLLVFLATVL